MSHRELLNAVHRDNPSLAFKVGGLDVLAAMAKVQAHDEATQASGSSGYSDLSAKENETDELGRKIMQHERDQRRLRNAVDGNHVLGKPRPRPYGAEHLHRHSNGIAAGQDNERGGSSGSNDSDPPLNVPRIWGRKGRRQDEWLRRLPPPAKEEIPAAHVNGDTGDQKEDADAIIPHRTVYTGDEEWTDVANDPMATTPPSMRRQRPASTPTSMQHMNSTLQEAVDPEDADFTSASLLASTPAVNRRDRKIDELTRREFENVESQRITKRSLQDLFKPAAAKSGEARPVSAPSGEVRQQARRKRSLISNKENVAPNNEVNANYKGMETVGIVNRNAQAVTFKNPQRPANRRHDSIDLLRRLSRVSSMSPVSDKNKIDRNVLENRPRSQPGLGSRPTSARSANSEYSLESPTTDENVEDDQGPELKAALDMQSQSSGGRAKVDGLDDVEGPMPDIDITPAPKQTAADSKTPIVTGAWVDTPGPGLDVRPLLQTSDSAMIRAFGSPSGAAALEPRSDVLDAETRRIFSEPAHAKSALADILSEAKTHIDMQFGDTTIQSLENIINPDLDQTETKLDVETEGVNADDSNDDLDNVGLLSQAGKDRRQEELAMLAMNKHLRAARTSLEDANRGMRRVENRIETVQQQDALRSNGTKSQPVFMHEASTVSGRSTIVVSNGKPVCSACGGTYHGSVWYALWSEFRSCFYTYDRKAVFPPGVRPTWLGAICLWWLMWYVVESTLCSYYCHPLYASYTTAYFGVDPDAPIFPFVIPTLAFRPVRFIWKPAFEYVGMSLSVLANAIFSNNAASAEPEVTRPIYAAGARKAFTNTVREGSWMTATNQASARITQSVGQALDDVGSMWDDEYLS